AEQWPPLFVETLLPRLIAGLGSRSTAAFHVQVAAAGSVSTNLPGTEWTLDSGASPLEVVGPDWALLAWLIGRPNAPLSTRPELTAWI
ncbi:MAG: hypothetical protein ABI232_10830, partial [Jatrophihabitantaceae bacterium]